MRRRSAIHALLCAAAVAHASDKPAIISRFRLQHSAREEQRFATATVLAKDPELLGRGRGRGRGVGRHNYLTLTHTWLASLRKTGTRMKVVLLTSGYDDAELATLNRVDGFDRIINVNSSQLHFKYRTLGDGFLSGNLARADGQLRIKSRHDGRMTTLKYWAWKLDFDGVLLRAPSPRRPATGIVADRPAARSTCRPRPCAW